VIEDLGGGTDYSPFFHHLGIPSTDFAFSGDYGVYHSIFDNHFWMKHFGDPDFKFHVAAAQVYGLQVLRLVEADMLPFDYEAYGRAVQDHLSELANKLILLDREDELDFEPAHAAANRLMLVGKQIRVYCNSVIQQGQLPQNLKELNHVLATTERTFLLPNGLPGRPWFKHAIYDPGIHLGYVAVPIPGVHESVDEGDFEEARRQLEALTAALVRASELLATTLDPISQCKQVHNP
jgi:N-acetylated-alpha-linked acidic dipeptidase